MRHEDRYATAGDGVPIDRAPRAGFFVSINWELELPLSIALLDQKQPGDLGLRDESRRDPERSRVQRRYAGCLFCRSGLLVAQGGGATRTLVERAEGQVTADQGLTSG